MRFTGIVNHNELQKIISVGKHGGVPFAEFFVFLGFITGRNRRPDVRSHRGDFILIKRKVRNICRARQFNDSAHRVARLGVI